MAFVGHQLDGKGDFTDFIKNRHGQDVRPAQVEFENPISHAMRQGCNYRELEACSAQILDTLEAALHEAKEAHKEAVNKIMNQYGEDMAEGVIGAVIAGAVAGGIAGAAAAGGPHRPAEQPPMGWPLLRQPPRSPRVGAEQPL